ncbi:MAG: winged helix-turn-helix transcriptional regulator, partial [Candidatus Hermodarchaeota archaeon]
MDSIDKAILYALGKNCRASYEDLARDHGISANAIKRRVTRLQKSGVIHRYVVRLSWSMVDAHPLVIFVYSNRSYDDEEFMEQLGAHPLVGSVRFDSYGSAVVRAGYREGNDIFELSKYFRALEGVNEIEIHPIPAKRGARTTFSKLQLRVLAQLAKDARMPISRIASKSRLTAKRVRSILNQLHESQSVSFTIDIDPSAGSSNLLTFRIIYQPNTIKPDEVVKPLTEEFSTEFWNEWHSASQNLMWIDFVLENVRDAEPIAKRIRMMPGVEIQNTIVPYSVRRFTGYRD